MDSRMFREEELLDELVVDREGYVCGRIASFSVEKDRITINLYRNDSKKLETPNEKELINRLLGALPQRGVLRRETGIEQLYDLVRETLHLSNTEPVTLEHLIACAKTKNIEVPYKTEEVTVKVDKGSVDWSYVDKVAFTELGKCLLLKEALEAENRGVALSEGVGYKSTEHLSGRLVIDSEAKMVGSAAKFLIGDPPGVLINVERAIRIEQMDSEALKKTLVPSRFKSHEELFDAVRKDLRLKMAADDNLIAWARKNHIDIPKKVTERREVGMELPVDWNKVDKIGDVVILKEPIDLLIQESLPPMPPPPEPRKTDNKPPTPDVNP